MDQRSIFSGFQPGKLNSCELVRNAGKEMRWMCLNGRRVVDHHRGYCQDEREGDNRQVLQNRSVDLLRGATGFVELQGFIVGVKSVCFHGGNYSR